MLENGEVACADPTLFLKSAESKYVSLDQKHVFLGRSDACALACRFIAAIESTQIGFWAIVNGDMEIYQDSGDLPRERIE